MKRSENIENQLSDLKKHYKVPDAYFENLNVPKPKSLVLKPAFKLKKTLLFAAALLLLVSLGYKVFNWRHKNIMKQNIPQNQVSQTDQLFDDLTDDEIIDYLSGEDLWDQDLE